MKEIMENNIKYFVKLHLHKSVLAEVVYAQGPKDAEEMARCNTTDIIEKWNESVVSVTVLSYYELGEMACNTHNDLTYDSGEYYYNGRKVSNNMNFLNGFGHQYRSNQVQEALETGRLKEANKS